MPILHPFPYFAGFEPANPYLPSFYAQADDLEQRIMYLCREYCKLIQFTDSMVDTLNDSYAVIQDMQKKLPGLIDDATAEEIGRMVESGQFAEMVQAALDSLASEIRETVNAADIGAFSGGTVYVDDFEKFVNLGTAPSGSTLQSITISDGTLYAAYWASGNTSYIRRYPDIESYTAGDTASYDLQNQITNNHCNSLSAEGGYLYAIPFNGPNVTKINASTLQQASLINVANYLRTGAVSSGRVVTQPYGQNIMDIIYPFDAATNVFEGLRYPVSIASQEAYVQDSEIYNDVWWRMCSATSAKGQPSYIEGYPLNTNSAPVVIPIITDQTRIEHEGLTFSSAYCYVSRGNTLYRSRKIVSLDLGPQVKDIRTGGLRAYHLGLTQGSQNSGMPYTDNENGTYTLPVPSDFLTNIFSNRMLSANLCIAIQRVDGRQGTLVSIPMRYMQTDNQYFMLWGGTGDAIWCILGLAKLTSAANESMTIQLSKMRYFNDDGTQLEKDWADYKDSIYRLKFWIQY